MIIKHQEIKSYEYSVVKVCVKIDYDKETISVLDHKGFNHKNFVFANRGLSYMKGWLEVCDAIKFAVGSASDELREYLELKKEREEKRAMDIICAVAADEYEKTKGKK